MQEAPYLICKRQLNWVSPYQVCSVLSDLTQITDGLPCKEFEHTHFERRGCLSCCFANSAWRLDTGYKSRGE